MPGLTVVLHTFGQGARSVAPRFAAWASLLLISSALAFGFDQALINCCSRDDAHAAAIAASWSRDAWHDGQTDALDPNCALPRAAESRLSEFCP